MVLNHALAVVIERAEVVLRCGIALLRGFTSPDDSLRVVLRYAVAVSVQNAKAVLRSGMALLGGLAIPDRRLCGVMRQSLAVIVCVGEVVLCPGVALLGRFAKQDVRLGVIVGNTVTKVIQNSRPVCIRIPAFRCLTEPNQPLPLVLRHSLAVVVEDAKVELCSCIASICKILDFSDVDSSSYSRNRTCSYRCCGD